MASDRFRAIIIFYFQGNPVSTLRNDNANEEVPTVVNGGV